MKVTFTVDPSTLLPLDTLTPTAGQGTPFPTGLSTQGCGTLYFLNKSNTGVMILFEDGGVAILPAWWARPFTPKVKSNTLWLSQAYQLNTTGNPISMLYLETYQQNEDSSGLYSGPINYETNVGNSVSAQVNTLVNDGNAAGTQIIEATPSGGGSDIQIFNDGSGIISGGIIAFDNAGNINVKKIRFISGANPKPAMSNDGSGNLNIDAPDGSRAGQFNSNGLDLTTSGAKSLTTQNVTAKGTASLDNGAILSDGSGGLQVGSGGVANGAKCKGWSRFTGTGDGTYNHGMGIAPNHFTPCQDVAGSETMGYNTVTATQVTIKTGANLAFSCVAFVF